LIAPALRLSSPVVLIPGQSEENSRQLDTRRYQYASPKEAGPLAIGDRSPDTYFGQLAKQCHGGPRMYGAITDEDEMRANLRMNCIPESLLDGQIPSYDDFLEERRYLMAQKIRIWFEAL